MKSRIRAYGGDEDGSIIAFTVIMFLMMVVACGMAVDFMRHESARADLQNALDRGVLAAASLSQTFVEEKIAADPTLPDTKEERERQYAELIKSYMASRSFPSVPVLDVELFESVNGREITASASYDLSTFFLSIPGLTEMRVPANATAKQIAQDTEISLVLDVSGSMYNPDNRVTYQNDQGVVYEELRSEILKIESKRFAEYMLAADPSANKSKTAISVVPYSHQVAIPASMAAQYAAFDPANRDHDRGFCIDFDENAAGGSDFNDTLIDPANASYQQTQHFWFRNNRDNQKVNACSSNPNTVLPFSSNPTAIGQKIDGLQEEYLTAIYQGMKWGVTLLDPGTRPVIQAMAATNDVDPKFADRPFDYGLADTLKVVVLISDGANTWQPRIESGLYNSIAVAKINEDRAGTNNDIDINNLTEQDRQDIVQFWDEDEDTDIRYGNGRRQLKAIGDGDSAGDFSVDVCGPSGTGPELPVYRATNAQVNDGITRCPNPIAPYLNYTGDPLTKDTSGGTISEGDARLYEICAAAKDAGIIVYTIGFNVSIRAERALRECADEGNAFLADGTDLREQFNLIRAQIFRLRLTN